MKHYHQQIMYLAICLSLFVGMNLSQAYATESYVATVSFYQGFDIDNGVAEDKLEELLQKSTDAPNVLRLVVIEKDIEPESNSHNFNLFNDFYFSYDFNDFVEMLPMESVLIAALYHTTFNGVSDANIIHQVDFFEGYPTEIKFEPDYTLLLLTGNDTFFVAGNFRLLETGVSFEYKEFPIQAPEPSTIICLGIGLVVIGMLSKKIMRQKKMLGVLLLGFCLLGKASFAFSEEWTAPGERYDVNKYWTHDFNSCWAAAAANIFKHTGWNKNEHTNAQVIYDAILEENSSGSPETELDTAVELYDLQAKNYLENPCPCKKDDTLHCYEMQCNKLEGTGIVRYIGDRLNAGWGVYLNIAHTSYGHALTVWKITLESNNKGTIEVSDSDDGIIPDKTTTYVIEFKNNQWQINQYGKEYLDKNPKLTEEHILEPEYRHPHDAKIFKIYALPPKQVEPNGNIQIFPQPKPEPKDGYVLKTREVSMGGVDLVKFCTRERIIGSLSINGELLSETTRYVDLAGSANDAGSWRCVGKQVWQNGSGNWTWYDESVTDGISVTQACREQYNVPTAEAKIDDWGNAFSWKCYTDNTYQEYLGGVGIREYCQKPRWAGDLGIDGVTTLALSTRYLDSDLANNGDGGTWTCKGKSVYVQIGGQWKPDPADRNVKDGMSITQACREQKGIPGAYASAGNGTDAFSWKCYTKFDYYAKASGSSPRQPSQYTVKIIKIGRGIVQGKGINCGEDCQELYQVGDVLDLTAVPDDHSTFVGWIVNGSIVTKAILINSDLDIFVRFDEKK